MIQTNKMKYNSTSNITISIICAAYNCNNTIEDSIKSIIPHLSDKIEFIIIDGNSNDGTIDIIKKYESYLAYWVSEEDLGIYDAWNKGIKKARGKYYSFVGLDDVLCENYSSEYIKALGENPNIDFISSKMFINKYGKTTFGEKWEWNKFRKKMNIVHPGSLHNSNLFHKYGYFQSTFKIAGDYEFLLRVGSNLNSHFINKPTIIFSLNGISNKNYLTLAREVKRAKKINKSRNSFFINFEYFLRILIGFFSQFFKSLINNK